MPYYDYSDWFGDFVWYLFVPNLIGRFCLRLDVSLSFWEKFQVPAISVYHYQCRKWQKLCVGTPTQQRSSLFCSVCHPSSQLSSLQTPIHAPNQTIAISPLHSRATLSLSLLPLSLSNSSFSSHLQTRHRFLSWHLNQEQSLEQPCLPYPNKTLFPHKINYSCR